jgi:hypothetical protein
VDRSKGRKFEKYSLKQEWRKHARRKRQAKNEETTSQNVLMEL